LKVLIVHYCMYVYGGAEEVVVQLANYLVNKKHTVGILTTRIISQIRRDLDRRVKVYLSEEENLPSLISRFKDVQKDYDIINYHNHPSEYLSKYATLPQVFMFNEPSQIVLDGGHPPKEEIEAVRRIERIVVNSRFEQNRIKREYGVDSTINFYGIDYDFWSIKDDSYKWIKRPNIITVGWISDMKNQVESVRVLAEVKKEVPECRLLLVGNNTLPYTQKVVDLSRKLGVEDSVIFTGLVPRIEVRKYYGASDVALFPYKSQGGCLSPFQAICNKVPVIVYPTAIVSEILLQNNLGIVSDDPVQFIVESLNNSSLYDVYKAAEWVKDNLTWERYCRKMEEIMEELVWQYMTREL